MSRLKMLGGLALVGAVALSGLQQAHARPDYNKAAAAMYPDNKAAAEAKCGLCHGKEKKDRNDYGVALTKLLGEKNVKDADKIKEALKKAEGEKSSVEGKTFGDLLKEGKLPGKL